MVGRTLNHCTIVDKIGEGGMGEVYVAEDARLGHQVAEALASEGGVRRRSASTFRARGYCHQAELRFPR